MLYEDSDDERNAFRCVSTNSWQFESLDGQFRATETVDLFSRPNVPLDHDAWPVSVIRSDEQ